MKKIFGRKSMMIFIFSLIIFSFVNTNYTEFDLKMKKYMNDPKLTLYFETEDFCEKWVPALMAPISLINYLKNVEDSTDTLQSINFKNLITEKEYKSKELTIFIYKKSISSFTSVPFGKSKIIWPEFCLFGLGYSDVIPSDSNNYNSVKSLISSKQIESNIFSFDKWDLTDNEFIKSKLYIGGSHEHFLEENVGTCNNTNDTNYWGCIFNELIFLNKTFLLIKEENNNPYIIYFSSEINKIYLPNDFKENLTEVCSYKEGLYPGLVCDDVKKKGYLEMILRNDNMNITIEVDDVQRFYDSSFDNYTNIIFHDSDFIILPLTMFKNFHVQFDLDNNQISFFSNDTSILEIKKDEPQPTQNTDEPENSSEQKSDYGPSAGLIVFLVILGILIIGGLGYGGFLFWKKKHIPDLEKRFNKYSKFEDEDINENKLVY